jgi:DNA-binding NarL/FixJ family response regulator
MLKIVLADDHILVRQGLKRLLEDEPNFEVIGEVGDGDEAVEITSRLKPDILVTDLKMPRLDGIKVTQQVRRLSPNTRVIILSMYGVSLYVDAAFKAGACGYVIKKSSADGLIKAIRTVAAGKSYVSPSITQSNKDLFSKSG